MKSKYFTNSKCERFESILKKKSAWIPPRSPYNLIQELLYHDPWKLLVATMFLHKSAGKSAIPIFWQFIQKWGCAQSVMNEDVEEIEKMIQPLGLQKKRAAMLKRFSSRLEFLGTGGQGFSEKMLTCHRHVTSGTCDFTNNIHLLGEYMTKLWKYPIELHGIGKYGNDSYRIFCINEWRYVDPKDSKLVLYHKWLQENEHALNLNE